MYSCVYGAARAVELAHLFGVLGTPKMVVIGTCGALAPDLRPGDVVVPSTAIAREGVAHLYGGDDSIAAGGRLPEAGLRSLQAKGLLACDSVHLTWASIFAQSGQMVDEWRAAGYETVDMETATVYAVAGHFGFDAVALLAVWDRLDDNKSFLDPLGDQDSARLDLANAAVFAAALEITVGAS